MSEIDVDTYALRAAEVPPMPFPDLAYAPPAPRRLVPRIGLIGAGGISACHLDAYRTAGWQVAAISNRTRARAEARAAEYAPAARITDRYEEVLADPSIDVVDITAHPAARLPMIEAALKAGKHVLSQKPFVTDLADGERLVRLADERGLRLAVNQNGRWAPHHAAMRNAVRRGLIGDVVSVHVSIAWDHSWTAGTPFDDVNDLVLYDFGIHWFDFTASIVGKRAHSVFATATMARGQAAAVPLIGQALIDFEGGQAALVFDGAAKHGARDTTQITGTKGSLSSEGPNLGEQAVTLTTAEGYARPALDGTWFNDGFQGAMGALLCAIEDDVEPVNGAEENLFSLAISFAAIRSRRTGKRVDVGTVRRMES